MPTLTARTSSIARQILAVASWISAASLVVAVVSWHDSWVKSYWSEQFKRKSLFFGQPGSRKFGEPSAVTEKWAPTWIDVMRYESDLSVGLLAASVGLLLVDGCRRLRCRRVWREPGSVACATAVVAMSLCVLEEASLAMQAHRGLWQSPTNPFPNVWPHYELRIGLAVFGAWSVMAFIGRWRPRQALADRAGVVLGWLWLFVLLYRMLASSVIPFVNWGY
jgi:hypothetical protein